MERWPVLPAITLAEGILIDHPRTGLALAALDDSDPRHQRSDDVVPIGANRLVRRGRFQHPLGDTRQACVMLTAIQAEQVHPRGGRQQAADSGVVQEHGLLDERHHSPGIRYDRAGLLSPADQLILELAR